MYCSRAEGGDDDGDGDTDVDTDRGGMDDGPIPITSYRRLASGAATWHAPPSAAGVTAIAVQARAADVLAACRAAGRVTYRGFFEHYTCPFDAIHPPRTRYILCLCTGGPGRDCG